MIDEGNDTSPATLLARAHNYNTEVNHTFHIFFSGSSTLSTLLRLLRPLWSDSGTSGSSPALVSFVDFRRLFRRRFRLDRLRGDADGLSSLSSLSSYSRPRCFRLELVPWWRLRRWLGLLSVLLLEPSVSLILSDLWWLDDFRCFDLRLFRGLGVEYRRSRFLVSFSISPLVVTSTTGNFPAV